MHRKRLAPLLAVGAFAATLTTVGCAATATSTTATATSTTATSTAATTAASNAAKTTTHLIYYSVNSDGPRFQAILTGAVGDYGRAVSVYPKGQVDPEHGADLRLNLTRGSFLLGVSQLDRKVVTAFRHWQGNPATCSGSITVTAPSPIVVGSGTGAYQGISGAFTLTATVDEIDVKSGCTATGKFLAQVIFITGTGTVRTG